MTKTDGVGSIIWSHNYGGSADDFAVSIDPTPDGGYLVGGNSQSSDGDVQTNMGGSDIWIIKLSHDGDLQWQQTIGGSGSDRLSQVKALGNGYLAIGSSSSSDGDVPMNQGLSDFLIVKAVGSSSTCAITASSTTICSGEEVILSVSMPPNGPATPNGLGITHSSGTANWTWNQDSSHVAVYSWTYGHPGILVFGDSTIIAGSVQCKILAPNGFSYAAQEGGIAMSVRRNPNESSYFNGSGGFFLTTSGTDLNLYYSSWSTLTPGIDRVTLATASLAGFDVSDWLEIELRILSNGVIQGFANDQLLLTYTITDLSQLGGRSALFAANGHFQFKDLTASSNGVSSVIWSNGEFGTITSIQPSSSGYHYVTIQNELSTCTDSIWIEVHPSDTTLLEATILNGESYLFNEQIIHQAGTYVFNFINIHGCDSTVNLVLEILPQNLDCTITASSNSICSGEEVILSVSEPPNGPATPNGLGLTHSSGTANWTWNQDSSHVAVYSWSHGHPGILVFGDSTITTGSIQCKVLAPNGFNNAGQEGGIAMSVRRNPNESSYFNGSGGFFLTTSGTDLNLYYSSRSTLTPGIGRITLATASLAGFDVSDWLEIELRILSNGMIQGFANGQLLLTHTITDLFQLGGRSALFAANGHFQFKEINASSNDVSSVIWSNGESGTITTIQPSSSGYHSVSIQNDLSSCIDSIWIEVHSIDSITVNATILQGESYIFNGQILDQAGSYIANLINIHGCDSVVTLELTVDLNVSVRAQEAPAFRIWPNPNFGDQITIETDNRTHEIFNITLFDNVGRQIDKVVNPNNPAGRITLAGDLPTGLYMLHIDVGAHVHVEPLMILR